MYMFQYMSVYMSKKPDNIGLFPQKIPGIAQIAQCYECGHRVLQCVAVCCSVFQCVAVRCSAVQCDGVIV